MMRHQSTEKGVIKQSRGFTLVEVLVAISILVVAVVGPMTIAMRGLQSAFFAKEQLTATFLAQEGAELIRMHRDQYAMAQEGTGNDNWLGTLPAICKAAQGCDVDIRALATFSNCATANACRLRYDAAGVTSASRGMYTHSGSSPHSPYTRVVRLTDQGGGNNSDEVLVTVAVSWQSGFLNGTRTVTLQSRLFNQYDDY